MTYDKFLKHLRETVGDEPGAISAFAREHGLARSLVSMVLSGNRLPTPQLLAAIGFCRVISYECKVKK